MDKYYGFIHDLFKQPRPNYIPLYKADEVEAEIKAKDKEIKTLNEEVEEWQDVAVQFREALEDVWVTGGRR